MEMSNDDKKKLKLDKETNNKMHKICTNVLSYINLSCKYIDFSRVRKHLR